MRGRRDSREKRERIRIVRNMQNAGKARKDVTREMLKVRREKFRSSED